MNNFIKKINFSLKKPRIIIVTGEGRAGAAEAVFQVLKQYFKVKKVSEEKLPFIKNEKEILIFESDSKKSTNISKKSTNISKKSTNIKEFKFLIKKSSLPILIVTHIGDIPPDKYFFGGEKEKVILEREIAKILPPQGFLILNFDDETVREIKDETNLQEITFGFQKGADFRASDIKLNGGTNFKINYQGNIVPVWLGSVFGKEQIYSALSAAAVGTIFGLNLVEISQALKNYQSLPGKMRLIKGIKNSLVLDDSESATLFSMIEALEILGKINTEGRKIAVLGDVLGIGKYTIEAHETIGERVARTADILFTFGPRAKFIGKGAFTKGMAGGKIFQFDTVETGKLKLQDEIKEGDLILVAGSKEMEMSKIIQEIKMP